MLVICMMFFLFLLLTHINTCSNEKTQTDHAKYSNAISFHLKNLILYGNIVSVDFGMVKIFVLLFFFSYAVHLRSRMGVVDSLMGQNKNNFISFFLSQ